MMGLEKNWMFEQMVQHEEKINREGYAVVLANLLSELVHIHESSTIQGVIASLTENISYLLEHLPGHPIMKGRTILTIKSICEIFEHCFHARIRKVQSTDIKEIKQKITDLGEALAQNFSQAKIKLSKFAQSFLKSGDTILLVGYSSLIEYILRDATDKGKRLNVVVAESRPSCEGYQVFIRYKVADFCSLHKIHYTLITDNAVGFALESVDYVLVSAEAVTENGGIINRIGTYTAAICAKALKKPFYVAAENFKFSRLFPLNQNDLPEDAKATRRFDYIPGKQVSQSDKMFEVQLCDFTPPELITMLITDTGILTPSAISDELIQMFNN